MKAKRIFLPSALLTLTLLAGCSVKISDLTPTTVPANPSGIYTLSAKATIKNKAIEPSTVKAKIVIDGEEHSMKRSPNLGNFYFEYDYDIPDERAEARFYYILNYRMKTLTGVPGELKQVKSSIEEIKLIDRYSITLDANRAPVGTQLAVLGRGFSRGDTVFVGGIAAETTFVSQHSLEFFVPNLNPSSYSVEVRSTNNVESAGTLRVDPGTARSPVSFKSDKETTNWHNTSYRQNETVTAVTVHPKPVSPIDSNPLTIIPSSLKLKKGERLAMAFALNKPASQGGLYLDVTTDISDAIIMPEVIIPVGARTVNVTVEGAEVAEGSLYIRGPGIKEIVIPVTIQ